MVGTKLRNATLDSVRGVAILLVLLGHALIPANGSQTTGHRILLAVMQFFKNGGWTGVDLFFVMSGFLISGLLFREFLTFKCVDLKRFLIRRSFKIYPSFLFFLVVVSTLETIVRIQLNLATFPILDYLKDLFFLHNYLGGRWGQTWSLDVEEFFYLAFPLFIYLSLKHTGKLSLKSVVALYVVSTLIAIIGRFIANYNQPYSFPKQFTLTHQRIDAIALGVLISYIYYFHSSIIDKIMKYRQVLLPVFISGILINFLIWKGGIKSVITLSINPISYGFLFLYALRFEMLKNKTLGFIGRNSFNIYLWHYIPFYYSAELVDIMDLDITRSLDYCIYLIVYIIIGLAPGILATRYIELPFLKVRDRFYPSKRAIESKHVSLTQSVA
ncbi:acyltransferase family protein [Pedobacter deserti]|uniref:acyltransferase family protein n=1 Tax=Pedobacter deserti TaxID=2817382 RepID=UPI002109879B|nr:acyltransferase [Pedobacter sp. SYSU D00382]